LTPQVQRQGWGSGRVQVQSSYALLISWAHVNL
jgi:hypothetical protein